jgi:hypothetical protein
MRFLNRKGNGVRVISTLCCVAVASLKIIFATGRWPFPVHPLFNAQFSFLFPGMVPEPEGKMEEDGKMLGQEYHHG